MVAEAVVVVKVRVRAVLAQLVEEAEEWEAPTPLATPHSLAVESIEPVATTAPCGSNERQTISAEWPLNVCRSSPARAQSRCGAAWVRVISGRRQVRAGRSSGWLAPLALGSLVPH